MRNVLVVLFWLWVLAAVCVYAYRIYRRVAHGPKRSRTPAPTGSGDPAGSDADAPRRRGLLAGLSTPPPPPLPEGPVEARLPRSLQGRPAPAAADGGPGPDGPDLGEVSTGTAAEVVPPSRRDPTLAEALEGIRMPEELLPVVDPTVADVDEGRRASFAGTGTNVPTVAIAIGEELKRLGYLVDGLDTVTSSRAGLSAHRDGTTVAAAVGLDDDTGAVVLRLST